jgi:hypothetical protein
MSLSIRRCAGVWRRTMVAIASGVPLVCFAADGCDDEAGAQAGADRHFVVLAGTSDVFYDGSGPAFVMLARLDSAAQESEVGAVGLYADDDRRPLFGAVPAERYNAFLRDSDKAADVMLRVEITAAQYRSVLAVLRTWDRRARENALLYPDVSLDNILLVKQATEALNGCDPVLVLHPLDWGLDDDISENHDALAIPLEYFKKLRRLNQSLHVPDSGMPPALLAVESNPLPPRTVSRESQPVPSGRVQAPPHVHPPAAEHAHHPAAEHE